jgi:hypothetical protein
MAMPSGRGCYLDFGWRLGSRWERALPAADRSAFVERGSRSTRAAALAALLLVTSFQARLGQITDRPGPPCALTPRHLTSSRWWCRR